MSPFAMHAEQAARRAEHEVADLVAVGVVVVLESIVIDHLDAEAVAAMLFAQGREQPLFAELAPVEQRPPVAAHPAEQRFALFELDAFLAKLFEHVKKDLVPVFDLVADRQVESLEARLDEIELRRRQLQHPADVIEEVTHRAGQLPFGRDDLCGQRLTIAKEGQLLVHLKALCTGTKSKFNTIAPTTISIGVAR